MKFISSFLLAVFILLGSYGYSEAYNVVYYWGNNQNYPRIFTSNDLDYFLDKKSTVIKYQYSEGLGSTTYVIGLNIIGVDFQGNYEPRTFTRLFMVTVSTDGSYILSRPVKTNNNEDTWIEMTKENAGDDLYLYNAAEVIVESTFLSK